MTRASKISSGLSMALVELPEVIILDNILPRLPVKSLLRFACVSKRWRFAIKSDPEFAKLQYKLACQTTLSHKLLLSKSRFPAFGGKVKLPLESLDLDMPASTFGMDCSIRKVRFPFMKKRVDCVALLGSCNGLVFILRWIDDGFESFYVCNPSTGLYKKLKDPIVEASSSDEGGIMFYGVGYLSAIDDYKVLVAYVELDEYKVQLYSTRAREWDIVEDAPDKDDNDLMYNGTLSNEALHWLNGKKELVVFDLATEEFKTMPLPDFAGDVQNESKLGVSVGGCLCVSRLTRYGGCIDFWVMGEYGVADSWYKLYSVKLYKPKELLLRDEFLAMERCTIDSHGNGKGLVRIDHHAEEKEQVGYYKFNYLVSIADYVETLLWIN